MVAMSSTTELLRPHLMQSGSTCKGATSAVGVVLHAAYRKLPGG
jgi:hypothetical protein